MQKIILLVSFLLLSLIDCKAVHAQSQEQIKKAMLLYQYDADLNRLEHLLYWTGLIEEYKEKEGHYPFQQWVKDGRKGLVRIATPQQSAYFNKNSKSYSKEMDNNWAEQFAEASVQKLIKELERVLDRDIKGKYDPQTAPVRSPNWYNYFVTEDGYLFWIVCNTCGVTQISTLLMDGYTPSVNIASAGLKDQVTKALTRDEMINHETFKKWQQRKYNQEGFFRELEKQNADIY